MSTPELNVLRLDSSSVKVLAHPLRSRLLTTLRQSGPATATDLAKELDTNTGATSYHLRKLASVGLVADTGQGAGKRREWAAATRGHSWDATDFDADPDARAALGWLTRHYAHQLGERLDLWYDAEPRWPGEWRDALGLGDDTVLVNAEQAEQLRDELYDVLRRYRDVGAGDPSARKVNVAVAVLPGAGAEPPEPPNHPEPGVAR